MGVLISRGVGKFLKIKQVGGLNKRGGSQKFELTVHQTAKMQNAPIFITERQIILGNLPPVSHSSVGLLNKGINFCKFLLDNFKM